MMSPRRLAQIILQADKLPDPVLAKDCRCREKKGERGRTKGKAATQPRLSDCGYSATFISRLESRSHEELM